MLHTKVLKKSAFSILEKMMLIDEFINFNLAGGTALALQIGHRYSYDLDFFGTSKLEMADIAAILSENFEFEELHRTKNILVVNINHIKVDFVNYKYPLLNDMNLQKNIRLLSVEDIAAMKMDAIKGRGKKRDFYDLFFLLKQFSLNELLDLHVKKYRQDTQLLILKSLLFFEDAENDPPVLLLEDKLNWQEVKNKITTIVTEHVDKSNQG